MKVSFLGHCFPQWPSRLGKRRWRMQRNTTTVRLRKSRESATTALNPGSEGKCQQYTKHKGESERGKRGWMRGGSNSITSVSSFTGQRDTELWTANEISKSWVRYLPLSQSLGNNREVRQGEGWRWAQRKHREQSWTRKTNSAILSVLHFLRSKGCGCKKRHNFPSALTPLSWGVHA